MKLGACLKCGTARPLANLIVTASGVTVCPECRYARDAYAITHQVFAPPPVAASLVGPVVDVAVHRPKSERRSA